MTKEGKELVFTSNVYAHGVHIPDAGARILSDQYFDLLPHRPYRVRIVGKGVDLRKVNWVVR